MIVLRLCTCGRTLDVIEWAALELVRRSVHDGEQWQTRRCVCGAELEVTTHEDDAAILIAQRRSSAATAYACAKAELVFARICTTERRAIFLAGARRFREEARVELRHARFVEAMLVGIWKARELRNPRRRLGRNLQVVETPPSERKVAP